MAKLARFYHYYLLKTTKKQDDKDGLYSICCQREDGPAQGDSNTPNKPRLICCSLGYKDVKSLDVPMSHESRKVCWRLDKRGEVGETPFHICYLLDTYLHRQLGEILFEINPKLCLDVYEAPEYLGESALHLAIVRGNEDAVKYLVEDGKADVHARANGIFFRPEDQKYAETSETNYEGQAYYGEFPLSFAASFGQKDVYDLLIGNGADQLIKDTYGNTVLHMVVIHNQVEMVGHILKDKGGPKLLREKNSASLDPILLACKIGRHEMFEELLKFQSKIKWRWRDVTCATYQLHSLDSVGDDGSLQRLSALNLLIAGDSEGHLKMLNNPVIIKLANEKWDNYVREYIIARFFLLLLHLVCLCTAIWLREEDFQPNVRENYPRFVTEAILVLSSFIHFVYYVFMDLNVGCFGDKERTTFFERLKRTASAVEEAPAKFVFILSCTMILVCVPFRILQYVGYSRYYNIEAAIFAVATPGAWAYLLFFSRIHPRFGHFVIMIYEMCTKDIVRFAIIYMVFLLQFSQGFYFLFKDPDDQLGRFRTLWGTAMQIIHMTLGEFNYEDFEASHLAILTKIVFLVFAMLLPILLLNMLIAMMGNTYERIISRSKFERKKQYFHIILLFERTIPMWKMRLGKQEYAVKDSEGNRCIMVISNKTKVNAPKAKLRRGLKS